MIIIVTEKIEVSHGSGRNMHVNIHVATQHILKNCGIVYSQGGEQMPVQWFT